MATHGTLLAKLAKCGRCGAQLTLLLKRNKTFFICPNMQKGSCKGCYILEQDFIRQLVALLKSKKLEIVLEEK